MVSVGTSGELYESVFSCKRFNDVRFLDHTSIEALSFSTFP